MKIITKAETLKYVTRGKTILKDLQSDPDKMKRLEAVLRQNGFGDIADLAIELRDKYL